VPKVLSVNITWQAFFVKRIPRNKCHIDYFTVTIKIKDYKRIKKKENIRHYIKFSQEETWPQKLYWAVAGRKGGFTTFKIRATGIVHLRNVKYSIFNAPLPRNAPLHTKYMKRNAPLPSERYVVNWFSACRRCRVNAGSDHSIFCQLCKPGKSILSSLHFKWIHCGGLNESRLSLRQ